MNNIEVRLFGAFRNFTSEESITLHMEDNQTVAHIKEAILHHFKNNKQPIDIKLIEESALSTDKAILSLNDVVENNSKLAILPPVCGG